MRHSIASWVFMIYFHSHNPFTVFSSPPYFDSFLRFWRQIDREQRPFAFAHQQTSSCHFRTIALHRETWYIAWDKANTDSRNCVDFAVKPDFCLPFFCNQMYTLMCVPTLGIIPVSYKVNYPYVFLPENGVLLRTNTGSWTSVPSSTLTSFLK